MPRVSPSPSTLVSASTRARRTIGRASFATVAVVGVVALAGCGDSKPAYCQDVTNLKDAVNELPGLAKSVNLSGLQAQAKTIRSDADTLVASAKSDFPSETDALSTSVDGLESSVKALSSSSSASEIAAVAVNASALVNAVKSFTSATDSKCG